MKFNMMIIFSLIVIALLLTLAYVRFAPADIDHLHQDPATTLFSGKPNQYRTISPSFDLSVTELTQRLDDYAFTQARVQHVAGQVEDHMITYVQRTAIMGYPDYITIKAIPAGTKQSQLVIFSRSRFGYSDWGVNKRRVKGWLMGLRR